MTNGTSEEDRLSVEKHCDILATNARHRTDAMAGWFRLYLQLYSAIVGGAIYLRLQALLHPEIPKELPPHFADLSNLLVAFLGVASAIMVIDARRAERGQRKRLTQVAGRDERGEYIIRYRPSFCASFKKGNCTNLWHWGGCAVMVIVIAVSTVAFLFLNPLR